MKYIYFFLIILLIVNEGSAQTLNFYFEQNISSVNGYMEIPLGGQPNSNSSERPTFNELGINDASYSELGFIYDNPWLGIESGYQYLRLSGSNTLASDLTTHGIAFSAGSNVQSQDKFDLYHFGLQHSWCIQRLEIFPIAEIMFLNYSYRFFSNDLYTSRAFWSTTGRIGFGLNYAYNQNLFISASALSSIAHLSQLQVQTANIFLNQCIFCAESKHVYIFGGLSSEQIKFKDDQTSPNNIKLTLSPSVTVGLKFII
jgi:hypothetical protein